MNFKYLLSKKESSNTERIKRFIENTISNDGYNTINLEYCECEWTFYFDVPCNNEYKNELIKRGFILISKPTIYHNHFKKEEKKERTCCVFHNNEIKEFQCGMSTISMLREAKIAANISPSTQLYRKECGEYIVLYNYESKEKITLIVFEKQSQT